MTQHKEVLRFPRLQRKSSENTNEGQNGTQGWMEPRSPTDDYDRDRGCDPERILLSLFNAQLRGYIEKIAASRAHAFRLLREAENFEEQMLEPPIMCERAESLGCARQLAPPLQKGGGD